MNSTTFNRCLIHGLLSTSSILWRDVLSISGTGLSPYSKAKLERRKKILDGDEGWAAFKIFCAWCLTGNIVRIEGTEIVFDESKKGGKGDILRIFKEELVCVEAFGDAIEREFAGNNSCDHDGGLFRNNNS
jgi:hypothetical protein